MVLPLETPRLELRPLELADAEQVQRLFPKWDIVLPSSLRPCHKYPSTIGATTYR